MKFFRILIVSLVFASAFQSCKKETENLWNVEIDKPIQKINLVDISKEFYDPNVPLESFQQKYPWFQGTVSNEDFGKRNIVVRYNSMPTKRFFIFTHKPKYYPYPLFQYKSDFRGTK